MELSDVDLLSYLTRENSILDGKLAFVGIKDEGGAVSIQLDVSARSGASYSSIELHFDDVSEFGFTYSHAYVFGTIEEFRFIRMEEGDFYLTLDPDPTSHLPSADDGDFVRASGVTGRLTMR